MVLEAAPQCCRISWSRQSSTEKLSESAWTAFCESLKLLFDELDLQLPAEQEPMQNTYRRWLAIFQQKVSNRTFLLNALVGLVPPASHAKFLVHMQDQEGPRCVCMQCDCVEKCNLFFFGSKLTTLPALSLFTAYEKAIDALNVVTFHVTDTDGNDATESWLDLLE